MTSDDGNFVSPFEWRPPLYLIAFGFSASFQLLSPPSPPPPLNENFVSGSQTPAP